tara:strand:- start:334 stop:486 length:153 start_codon:yes stop_codon:yes gene_type:complete
MDTLQVQLQDIFAGGSGSGKAAGHTKIHDLIVAISNEQTILMDANRQANS